MFAAGISVRWATALDDSTVPAGIWPPPPAAENLATEIAVRRRPVQYWPICSWITDGGDPETQGTAINIRQIGCRRYLDGQINWRRQWQMRQQPCSNESAKIWHANSPGDLRLTIHRWPLKPTPRLSSTRRSLAGALLLNLDQFGPEQFSATDKCNSIFCRPAGAASIWASTAEAGKTRTDRTGTEQQAEPNQTAMYVNSQVNGVVILVWKFIDKSPHGVGT